MATGNSFSIFRKARPRKKSNYRGVHAQVAVRAVGILPALVPVNGCLNARITSAEKIEALFDPFTFVAGTREFAGRPFGDHDRFLRIKPGDFFIRPINQRRNIGPWFVLELLAINAQSEPIDVVGAGIICGREIPSVERIGIIIGVKHPFDIRRTARPDAIHHVAIRYAVGLRAFPILQLIIPLVASVINARPWKPRAIHLVAKDDDHRMSKLARGVRPLVDVAVPFPGDNVDQTETIRAVILLVRLVPGRPKKKRQRAMPPYEIEIRGRKILLTPVTRRSDNGLMFADHLLEVLD